MAGAPARGRGRLPHGRRHRGDVDVAEVHDCFAIAELIAYEELGFCEKGEAGPFVAAGRSDYGGDVVVNPRGGLIGCGHPLGATGVAQAAEIFLQLRGEAGARQVPRATLGLTHNNSGMGEHVVMIYGRGQAPIRDRTARLPSSGRGASAARSRSACALGGCRVRLVDLKSRAAGESEGVLADARREIARDLGLMAAEGVIKEGEVGPTLDRIEDRRASTAVEGCGLVQEALPERIELKREVFGRLRGVLAEDAIVASATSSIAPAHLASAVPAPERFLAVHWLNPAHIIPLVEVVPGPATAPAVVERTVTFLERAGQDARAVRRLAGFHRSPASGAADERGRAAGRGGRGHARGRRRGDSRRAWASAMPRSASSSSSTGVASILSIGRRTSWRRPRVRSVSVRPARRGEDGPQRARGRRPAGGSSTIRPSRASVRDGQDPGAAPPAPARTGGGDGRVERPWAVGVSG